MTLKRFARGFLGGAAFALIVALVIFLIIWFGIGIDGVSTVVTAVATGAMAIFTYIIKDINKRQLLRSEDVERAYVSGGGAMNKVFHSVSAQNTPIYVPGKDFVFCVNNYGKTAGELREVGYGFCDANNIPEVPSYEGQYFYDWIMPGDRARVLFQVALPAGKNAVYGRFYYRDIFGKRHSCGFINRVSPDESVPIIAPPAYTDERDDILIGRQLVRDVSGL